MKQIFGQGARLFLRIVLVTVMSMFVCVSVSALFTALFTENIGYEMYELQEGGDPVLLYTHYDTDGEDTQLAEYEKGGRSLRKVDIRSEMSKTERAICYAVMQTLTLIMLAVAVYPQLWRMGAADSNLVRFGHQARDRLKGLKIGLVSQIPALLIWAVTVVLSRGAGAAMPVTGYRLLQAPFWGFVQMILGSAETLGDLSVLQLLLLLLPLAIVPLIGFAAYVCGYAELSVSEKLIYKNSEERKR